VGRERSQLDACFQALALPQLHTVPPAHGTRRVGKLCAPILLQKYNGQATHYLDTHKVSIATFITSCLVLPLHYTFFTWAWCAATVPGCCRSCRGCSTGQLQRCTAALMQLVGHSPSDASFHACTSASHMSLNRL
jgi:hypothetical protein